MWVKATSFGLQVDLRLLSKNNCIRQKQLELLAKYSINQNGTDFEPPVHEFYLQLMCQLAQVTVLLSYFRL